MHDRALTRVSYYAFGAIVVSVVLEWLFSATSWSRHTHLTVVGAMLEVVGIALVAVDFWLPWVKKCLVLFRGWADVRADQFAERTRNITNRLLGRRIVAKRGMADAGLGGSGDTIIARSDSGRLPSTAELVRRLHVMEERLRTVEDRLGEAAKRVDTELANLRSDVQDAIVRSKDQYLGARIVGLAIAVAGSIVLAAANLA